MTGQPVVTVTSPFWTRYRHDVVHEVIPYQWSVINDERQITIPEDPSGAKPDIDYHYSRAVRNLRIAAGEESGEFKGFVFQDSDVYKWLEEAAYALSYEPDEGLVSLCDRVVDLIARAQCEDGYLDTPFQIRTGEYANRTRFSQIQKSHEMYVMGHCIEAVVAYYGVTGNTQALAVAEKMASCLSANFGPEDGKIHGADGHPEIELALARLYEVTHKRQYLDLAGYFIDIRGVDPDFYDKQTKSAGLPGHSPEHGVWSHDYMQVARPIREQQTADGHAVRATYLLTGVAHMARLTGDDALADTARRLWNNIVTKRMYITGAIGSTHVGESFTYDYDLPNDTMYGESCASVGMSFLARRMLELDTRGEYADVLEKELFNGAISGIALDGKHFYYVNPLDVDPSASEFNPDRYHVLPHRAEWFGCACCPANIARLIASVDRYLYTVHEDRREIVAHQFIANEATFFDDVTVSQRSDFPWDGDVEFTVTVPDGAAPVRFLVRIPGWSSTRYSLTVQGADASDLPIEDGFVTVEAQPGATSVTLRLDMSVKFMRSNGAVRHDAGKVAVMRGPVVYCAEEADNAGPLWNYRLRSRDVAMASVVEGPDELGDIRMVTVPALRRAAEGAGLPLYAEIDGPSQADSTPLKLVPYYIWANRSVGQMQVWFDSDW